MQIKRSFFGLLLFITGFALLGQTAFGQEGYGSDKGSMGPAKKVDARPIVAVVYAEWCGYCKNVEPVVADLKKEYGERLRFVVFDVTNDETSAKAMAKAEKLGLAKFFADNKERTSTVAVIKKEKILYKTSNNSKRADYVKAFDSALE